MSSRALVVSIHDVSPVTRDSVTSILAELDRAGICRVSLLVVPNFHHRANIIADPAFGSWLRDLVAAGHEPTLHGCFHQRERRPRESARTRFFTRLYTADEGEFFDISFDAARSILTMGRDQLAQVAGVVPAGFIAPAWLLSTGGEAAARDLGFAYTTRLNSISDLPGRRLLHSQSLCWSVRSQWRRLASIAWNPFLFQRLRPNPLLRLSIHPPDIAHPAIWRQILRLAARALEDREPLAYLDFVTRWRNQKPF